MDTLFTDNNELRERIQTLEEEKINEVSRLQKSLDKIELKCENIENEKDKIQEEYDTLLQTYHYTSNELEEKKKRLIDMQVEVRSNFLGVAVRRIAIKIKPSIVFLVFFFWH